MWIKQENNQYFYNVSRLMLRLGELYPIEVCNAKVLTKCSRPESITCPGLYVDGLRSAKNLSWIWILKVASRILETTKYSSTIVVYEINEFFKKNKERILKTLNEPRSQRYTTSPRDILHHPSKTMSKKQAELTLAQVDEMEATLEFVACLLRCEMWVIISRKHFEELLYVLMHRTIFMFSNGEDNSNSTRKLYKPYSDC